MGERAVEKQMGATPDKAIVIRGLHYAYPDGTAALRGIDIEVSAGESIGLIGCNGAGKSTLLLHLNGILKGSTPVKIMGEEITNENLARVRARVGMIFQDPDNQLFMPTVSDDVGFGPVNMGMSREEVNLGQFDNVNKAHLNANVSAAKLQAFMMPTFARLF